MIRIATAICILTVALAHVMAMSKAQPDTAALTNRQESITIFVTGNTLGSLKPCGCSGGQLGGLERRSAILETTAPPHRLIIDTGSFVETNSEQDQIKFNVMMQALNLLDYDVLNLTEKDLQVVQNFGPVNNLAGVFDFITYEQVTDSNIGSKFTKEFSLHDSKVKVTVVSFNTKSGDMEKLSELFGPADGSLSANILIANHCDEELIKSVSQMPFIDCLICPPESDEPMEVKHASSKPLVISTGRLGKYIAKLHLKSTDPNKVGGSMDFLFSPVALTDDLSQNQSLVTLYKDYQKLVKQADLLTKSPKFPLPNYLSYTGSESCKLCHEYEYEKWSTKAHAHAYPTIEKIGSQFDPECVVCHVVGFEYESGFVSELKSQEDLKNVGCENCHGPGSEHIKSSGEAKTTAPAYKCVDCHTLEMSVNYAGNEDKYFRKIIHWREPNSTADVK